MASVQFAQHSLQQAVHAVVISYADVMEELWSFLTTLHLLDVVLFQYPVNLHTVTSSLQLKSVVMYNLGEISPLCQFVSQHCVSIRSVAHFRSWQHAMLPSMDYSDTDVHAIVHGNTISTVNQIFGIWGNLMVTNMDLDISLGSHLMQHVLLKVAHSLRKLHICRFHEYTASRLQ